MKKLFSLFASLFMAVTLFAAEGDIVGAIAGTLTGGTPQITNGMNTNTNRGGFIVKEDGVFFCNNQTGKMLKAPLDLSAAPAEETDSIGLGYYMDIDDAGRVIIYQWTSGSGTMDIAQVYDADKKLVRNDTLKLNGRCDMPTMIGNMVEGRGAYFTACNSAKAVLRHNVVDGVLTSIDTIAAPVTLAGNSSVAPVDVDHFYVQSRGNALFYVDMSGENPVVKNLSFFSPNTFTSAYGGKVFSLAGHTLYVMGTYKVAQYLGSFAVFDITDPDKPYVVAEETSKMGTSAMGTACVTFRVVVEDQKAIIYEYACYAVRRYELSVKPAAYLKQGAEGEEWKSMVSVGDNFTLRGIYAGADSILVNGTAADANAQVFKPAENITFEGTVVAKDTVDFIYNPADGGKLTVKLIGTFVPCIEFAVTVPEETPNCFIAGNFNNWGFQRMVKIDDTHYKYKYVGTTALQENVEYKYACGADWKYVEKNEDGSEKATRTWAAEDVVAKWAEIPVVNKVTYELNGGVANDYGWKTKGEILLDFQKDINEALGKSFTWAKMEDGIVYYNMNGTWKKETEVIGEVCTITGFVQNTTYNTSDWLKTFINTTKPEKYAWLKDVMISARKKAGLGVTDEDMVENVYRKEIAAFFLNSPADGSWPASASFEAAGTVEAFMPIWKHGFVNPETVIDPFVLNAPYKAGFTFDGWYANQDFSGEKVVSIDANSQGTLYAKWVEYIPTLEEVTAMDENEVTKAMGVVTFINGKNVYIQDASAGMLLYMKAAPTFKVADLVVVSGTKTTYGGAPELKDVEEVSAEAGTMPKAVALGTLAAAKAEPLKYFGQLIAFKGLKITALDSYKNPSVTDGIDTVLCYKMSVDDAIFPVGTKVDITAIAGYFNGFQLVGDPAGIVEAGAAAKDEYAYPAYGSENEYTLTNKWIISNVRDNFTSNAPSPADHARGMVAKDGKIYFINRAVGGFTVVDGATGKMANDPILITGDHLFQAQDSTFNDDKEFTGMEWKPCVTLPYNDVKLDQAGHFLIGACVSGGQRFQIYKVDIATGAATEVVNDRLYDYADWNLAAEATTWRFDAFNVYGDVDSKAIIMAADANSFYVYYWEIENGVAGEAQRVNCTPDPSMDQSLLIKEDGTLSVSAFGTAPQVFPIDYEYFYVDGWNTLPMLFDMEGSIVQDFISVPTGVNVKMGEEECTMNVGHNGLCEFQVGSEYYLVMAATNTVGSPTSAFALYKYANEDREFSEMTPMWYFPHEGMGSATNGCRTAVPTVEVKGNVATIYVYTNNNGYGVYEFTGVADEEAVANVGMDPAIKAEKRIENGNLYIIRNGVRYSAQGVVAE